MQTGLCSQRKFPVDMQFVVCKIEEEEEEEMQIFTFVYNLYLCLICNVLPLVA